jgi:hypothetical protein
MRGSATRVGGHARWYDRSPRAPAYPPRRESAWISAIAPASAMGSRGSVFPECRGTFFFGDLYGACLSRLVLDGKRMQRPAGDHDHMVRLVPAL